MLNERIKTKNNKENLRNMILPFIERLSKKPGVLAIVLLGGISNNNDRNHTDEFSDIDVGVIFDDQKYSYLPNYEFYLYDGDKPIEVNVHQMLLSIEEKEIWDDGKKEAYSKCEYLYEKNDLVRNFIDDKIKITDEYRKRRLALLIGQYKWYVEINPLRAIKRGLYANGIDLLNKGIELFVEALYLYNYQYLPHCKWRIDTLLDLKYIPENLKQKICDALLTIEVSENGILIKRDKVIILFKDLISKITEDYQMNVDELYEYACKNSYSDRQLLKKTYADKLIEKIGKNYDDNKKRLISSFVNYYIIGSDQEILKFSSHDVEEKYKNVLDEIKRSLCYYEK